jgi:O-antigen ligase
MLPTGTVRVSPVIQRLLMAFIWLTFFMNGFVLKEPAPCDLFMMAFLVLMPLFGMVRFTLLHGLFLTAWMIIISCGLIASGFHEYWHVSLRHMIISLYLALFSVVLAAFVTLDPGKHLKIIWRGYMMGAIFAATAGIIGYFDLIPGSYELFTKYERARGTFKDPNVYAPFLVPAFLYCLHSLLTHGLRRGFIDLLLMGLFLFSILMSFSRGAWFMFAVASSSYVAIYFFAAPNNSQRVKTLLLSLAALFSLIMVIGLALQFDRVQELFTERVSLSHSYDVGDSGRFAGHAKAANIILENPLGIGALYFGYYYHHELPHNLYLSMFLSAGWIGGTLFLILMVATLIFGFKILLTKTSWMHYHAIAFCSFFGLMLESYIIDSDHWRQLYILMGMIWGGYAALRIEEIHEDAEFKRRDLSSRGML